MISLHQVLVVLKEDPYYSDVSLLGKGTNWQDAIFQTAFQQQHQIAAQGGTDKYSIMYLLVI